jgi:sarcosine oxidase subunit delta
MLYIHCPYCREQREETEFSYSGEAHIERSLAPQQLSDEQWGDYLFFRTNPRGLYHEMWYHVAGCRRYFNVTRNTQTYVIYETYMIDQQPNVTKRTGTDR